MAGLPVIGSVHELPERNSWLKFHEWGQQYGSIYQVNLAGVNHVWITRDSVAHDLLSKRSGIYSDRPFIPALSKDNRTSEKYLPLMSKTEKWSRQRKFGKQIMDTSGKASYYGYPELESIRLLFELITKPAEYNVAMESFIARVTCRLAWGTAAPSDELKQRARELLVGVSPAGSFANKLPFIMSLPEQLIKSKAWESRRTRTERKFFDIMQQEVAAGMRDTSPAHTPSNPLSSASRSRPSWMRMFLERKASWGFASELEGAFAVGMHGIAGPLTIAAPMQSFCLALCQYPQYQHILHEEVDRVLDDRMPTFDDMANMPVLRAFIRETLRWRPPVPTGIPHEVIQDDMYNGFHIPAGSVIHPLEWSISRDPKAFLEPDEWNPMRWLEPQYQTYREPLTKFPTITHYSQFGYGRRICQGMGVTEADLFVGLGSVAWLFSMDKDEPQAEPKPSTRMATAPEVETLAPLPAASASSHARSVSSEQLFFERNAELLKRCSLRGPNTPNLLPPHLAETPPTSDDEGSESGDELPVKATLGLWTMHGNDSAISVPGEFPVQPLDVPTHPSTRMATVSQVYSPALTQPAPSQTSLKLATSSSPPPIKNVKSEAKDDPTMNFSTLLIAKPLPFKFNLTVRNKERAMMVARKWAELRVEEEFEEARVFWGKGMDTAGDKEFGWGEVFS
ncbi:hypothetical protein LTR62_006795 [Meristemomyces frigidus]|uniref:Cytochrome P450 n=1 Tax=Meristemomyces frigidus TaxID=1508187 RepID=A0AAN7TJM3_9PEZI|nr:hypothetical protein LTR62_006795 [Meristemomyces frigidus]